MKLKTFIAISLIYIVLAIAAFMFRIEFLQFFLAVPWSMILTIGSAAFHTSYQYESWFLAAAFLNVGLFSFLIIKEALVRHNSKLVD